MHLLMIAPEQIAVPPPKGGSVEICMLAIAKRLARHHKVTLISRRFANYPPSSKKGDFTIIRVPTSSPNHYIRAVMNYIRGKHYDWIQIDNRPRFVTHVRKSFPKTSISVFLHSLTFVAKSRISKAVALKNLGKADIIIANSSSLQSELSARFPSLRNKIKQVHLGVDLQQFRPLDKAKRARLRKKYGLQGSYVFAFAGRIIPRKGIPVLIKAMSKVRKSLPQVKLVIAGSGNASYRAGLINKAKRLGISAVLVGYISHRKMHEVYGMSDCLVCPSQKHEAFGLVNVEAMATGIPVIASQIGGIKETIRQSENGMLIEKYKNSDAFAAVMLKLAKDRSYSQALGKQARIDMEQQFGWAKTVQSLSRLYNK
jgi:spore coat protein SA